MPKAFFNEQKEQSEVKTAIVAKYFGAWSHVISAYLSKKQDKRIAYIDLFAGPGRFDDGSKSTPLLILEMAIQNEKLRNNLVTVFTDKEDNNTSTLKKEICKLPGIETLRWAPEIRTEEVGDNIVKEFESRDHVPTLMFIDPFGYKGLSLRLINSVLKDWACECIFFFNYNRISMGVSNDVVQEHMEALFGVELAAKVKEKVCDMTPEERELTIVEEMCNALIAMGGKFPLPFRFRNSAGTRTSHHIVFVSKHPLGYKIMKEVMAKESSSLTQGVPSFEYSPASERQPFLFDLTQPLDDLEGMLMEKFAGQTLTMAKIFDRHNIGKPYVISNYKDALNNLETQRKIQGNPQIEDRRMQKGKRTCSEETTFTFPKLTSRNEL